jgi:hypothetical protein
MPTVSSGYTKNVIRRAFSQLVDPSPDNAEKELVWKYFEGRCAFCDKSLTKGMKEAHIDHLVSASLGGANHISNRVLACATCNEKEKRDADWQEFLATKVGSTEELSMRSLKITRWQVLHEREVSEDEAKLLNTAAEAAADVIAIFDQKVEAIRKLRGSLKTSQSKPTAAPKVIEAHASASGGRLSAEMPAPKARYSFSRLCFKSDVIEQLEPADHFRVDTPDGSFQMSKEEFYRDFANVIESKSYREGGVYHYPAPPQHTLKFLVLEGPTYSLQEIVDRLDKAHQRATYGAVSSLVGRIARALMQFEPKNPKNSWIVSQATGLPTSYGEEQLHPCLRNNPHIIKSPTELAAWLQHNAQH